MSKIKIGRFYEYRDNVESFVVLATGVADRENYVPELFSGVVVSRTAIRISEDMLAREIGEVDYNLTPDLFTRVKNPLKSDLQVSDVFQTGKFILNTDTLDVVLINGVTMHAGGRIEFTGITVEGKVGELIREDSSDVWMRVCNTLKERK